MIEIFNGFLRTLSPFIHLRALGTIGPKYFHLEGGKLFWVRLLIGSGRVSHELGFDQHTVRKVEKRYGIRDLTATRYARFANFGARNARLGKIFGIAMITVRDARFA